VVHLLISSDPLVLLPRLMGPVLPWPPGITQLGGEMGIDRYLLGIYPGVHLTLGPLTVLLTDQWRLMVSHPITLTFQWLLKIWKVHSPIGGDDWLLFHLHLFGGGCYYAPSPTFDSALPWRILWVFPILSIVVELVLIGVGVVYNRASVSPGCSLRLNVICDTLVVTLPSHFTVDDRRSIYVRFAHTLIVTGIDYSVDWLRFVVPFVVI